ncbi:MAG: hypothetical protein JRN11_04800 [Nitrososphaerota archaeon]|nr:hypothetical protein [Nitrososphaerota archaeon]MDG7026046.1 hypothetical protein [Nitrososphaerota archaeon]
MKGKTGPVAEHLRPILDAYLDSAVALVGCASRGMQRYSCEFDILVVTEDPRPETSLKLGDVYVDMAFVTEEEVLKPRPERALALASAKPVRDTALTLSTAIAASSATLSSSAGAASTARLGSALKALGRSEDALGKGRVTDADYWLLAASQEFAFAVLLANEAVPSPSHLLSQLRVLSKGAGGSFEAVAAGAGLEAASRAGCGARLEGVTILHDILRGGRAPGEPEWPAARTEILSAKAEELVTRMELAECYSFLGGELVEGISALLRRRPKDTVSSLTSGDGRLLGERLVRQLGLSREEQTVRHGVASLKEQVAALAKRPRGGD